MNVFYVDESGSMTKKNLNYKSNQYFIICMVMPADNKKLKKVYSRFISSNINQLRNEDLHQNLFYPNGKFKEIKGAFLSVDMKKKFINYFCHNNLLNIYYICLSNKMVEDYFYVNKARAFNYLIKLTVEYNTLNNNIKKDTNYFYIDERNVKTATIATLGEYLNIELVTAKHIQRTFIVEYCQSESKELIQIADVFSNIYYSFVKNDRFNNEINFMRNQNYIKNEFYFPVFYWQLVNIYSILNLLSVSPYNAPLLMLGKCYIC